MEVAFRQEIKPGPDVYKRQIEDETGRALTGISQTAPGKMLKIHLADGVVAAKTTAVYASGSGRKESDGREDGR